MVKMFTETISGSHPGSCLDISLPVEWTSRCLPSQRGLSFQERTPWAADAIGVSRPLPESRAGRR